MGPIAHMYEKKTCKTKILKIARNENYNQDRKYYEQESKSVSPVLDSREPRFEMYFAYI